MEENNVKMIRQWIKPKRSRILIDVNTQKDFFLADGSVCIRNHRRVLAHIRRMIAWARRNNIPVISTCEVYSNNNNGGNGANYCLDGTDGQKKITYTLLNNRISFPADNSADLSRDVLRQYRQVILHKRCFDPFDEPRIDRLLSELRAKEFVLIGASAEGAVAAMALGLLLRGKRVTVITDAVGSHDKNDSKMAFRKMKAKGARLVETKRFAGNSHLKSVGICSCQMCHGRTRKTPLGVKADY